MVGCRITGSGSGLLLNCVCASEGYFDVCLFEKVGDFSDFMAVVCEGGPIFSFVFGIVCVSFLLCVSFQSCYEVGGEKTHTCRAILQLQINILPSCITLVLLYILTYEARKSKHKKLSICLMQAEHSFNSPALKMQGRLFMLGNLFCRMMKQVVTHIHEPSISLIF